MKPLSENVPQPSRVTSLGKLWLKLFLIILAVMAVALFTTNASLGLPYVLASLIAGVVGATVLAGIWLFIRWLCCWRNLRRALIGLAGLVTLIAVLYAEENWRGRHAWEQFQRQEEIRGLKLDLAACVPPPVPDEQNFAFAPVWMELIKTAMGPQRTREWYGAKFSDDGNTNFVPAFRLNILHDYSPPDSPAFGHWQQAEFLNLQAWQEYYRASHTPQSKGPEGAPLPATNDFPVAAQPQTPAADVLLALSKYDATIEALREASHRSESRFPVSYYDANPNGILLPHLACLKRGSQVLHLRALAELQQGATNQAAADVQLAFYLMQACHTEPFMISHLVRLAMLQIILQPIWEGLAEHRWSEAQLAAFETRLADIHLLADYESVQRSDEAFFSKAMNYWRQSRNAEYLFYENESAKARLSPDDRLLLFVFQQGPAGWFYQNQLRYCRFTLQNYLPVMDASRQLAFPAKAKEAEAARQREASPFRPYSFIENKILFPIYSWSQPDTQAEKFVYGQTTVNLARVAIALERYRLAQGECPATLELLAPRYLATVPHDLIGGQPLHYQRTAGGTFRLYSIGWNETDDAGQVAPPKQGVPDWDAADWVWPGPVR
ncbi:MAG TPA: hypothetical protein VL527_04405 [Dongiaceae bacterium]|nr:hypothetical protein [Dongiaceae bacterium]